jgi:hypothetical protein
MRSGEIWVFGGLCYSLCLFMAILETAVTMKTSRLWRYGLLIVLISAFCSKYSWTQTSSAEPKTRTPQALEPRDGQHDFDFALGTWKTHLKRLQHPLTGSGTWVEYDGQSVVRKVWNGRANLEEFQASGPGHIEALTLRLYNPESRQWNQVWSTSSDGNPSQTMIGEFKNGRGEFFDQEPFNGRSVFVRWVWSDITPNSCRFEQSFSDDGGKSWEVNWVNTYSRVGNESD